MVPAASSRSWLKSRLFKGNELTAWLDSASPPEVADWLTEGVGMGTNEIDSSAAFAPGRVIDKLEAATGRTIGLA
jgi:hypothetical protein